MEETRGRQGTSQGTTELGKVETIAVSEVSTIGSTETTLDVTLFWKPKERRRS